MTTMDHLIVLKQLRHIIARETFSNKKKKHRGFNLCQDTVPSSKTRVRVKFRTSSVLGSGFDWFCAKSEYEILVKSNFRRPRVTTTRESCTATGKSVSQHRLRDIISSSGTSVCAEFLASTTPENGLNWSREIF